MSRLLTDTDCVLLNSFPVSPPSPTLTLFSLPSQLQENLGSTWPLTLRLSSPISTACRWICLWYVPALWKRLMKKKDCASFPNVLRWEQEGRIIFPGVSSWLWERVVSLSGKNWSLVWSWVGAMLSNWAVLGFGHGGQRSPNYYHSLCVVLAFKFWESGFCLRC